ncbi:MAG: SPOR domain-containing protein [Nitrospinota bacterium]|nr:MAG: SPOR domain-containing protein [Nitrospinota bacterium]
MEKAQEAQSSPRKPFFQRWNRWGKEAEPSQGEEQPSGRSSTRGYYFRLDRRQLVLLIGGYLLICVLVFLVGVLVGKGLSPHPVTALAERGTQGEAGHPAPLPPDQLTEEVVVAPKKIEELSFYRTLSAEEDRPVPVTPLPQEGGEKQEGEAAPYAATPEPKVTAAPAGTTPPRRAPAESSPRQQAPAEGRVKPVSPSRQQPQRSTGRYTVQVSSFRELSLANNLKEKLQRKGFDAYVSSVTLPNKGVWHRVQIGSYQQKAEAEQVLRRIQKEENLAGLITRR